MSALVSTDNLKKYFSVGWTLFSRRKEILKAVDGVNLTIRRGENFGLAGESGCGKTTLGRLILGLIEPTEGAVYYEGRAIYDLTKREMRDLRREMQIVFQDPTASLNPRRTISYIVSQPLRIQKICSAEDIQNRVVELLETVGLSPAELFWDRYPHELSGGQRQRVVIARALALEPKFVVADEPVSALDMSIKVQIIKLMKDLQRRFNLTHLFITHELAVVRSICDRTATMYLGKIVELAETDDLFADPLHPYTKALLSATPIPRPAVTRSRERIHLKGEVPSPINPPRGCRFHTRCPYTKSKCSSSEPELVPVERDHFVACHMS